MDTEFRRGVSKGAIFNAVNSAFGIANMRLAASDSRFFGMFGSGKVWTRFAKQSHSLLLFGFLGRNFSEPRLPNFLTGFFRPDISAIFRKCFAVPSGQMFGCGKTFEIFKSIVGLVTVNVMHMIGWIKIFHPTLSNNSVSKKFCSDGQISLRMPTWFVKGVLSKNFSAPRYSIKMVEGSILDAIHGKANHGEPLGVVTVIPI